jgi:hypothetical protein
MPIPNDASYLSDRFADVDAAFATMTAAQQRAWMISRWSFARTSGATHVEGAPLVAGETEHEVEYGSMEVLAPCTLDEYLTGTGDNFFVPLDVFRYMNTPKAHTYTTTPILKLDGLRIVDGDLTDSDSLLPTIAATGDAAITFDDFHAGLVGHVGRLTVSNSGGGARAITVPTGAANGVTVSAPGVTNPGLGSTAGNTLEVGFTILSTTTVRLDYMRAFA